MHVRCFTRTHCVRVRARVCVCACVHVVNGTRYPFPARNTPLSPKYLRNDAVTCFSRRLSM